MREDYGAMADSVQSIDRALALLTEIAERPDGLSGLARRVDIPTSTVGRLLGTLERADTVVRDPEGTYRIGPAIMAMAQTAGSSFPPLELAARPHLGDLADSTGEAAGLCVPVGDTIHCVAQVVAPQPVQAEDWTGQSWPLDQGGSGLVVLAGMAPPQVESYLARHPHLDRSRLEKRLARATADRVCWSQGDYREGLTSVACPVLDHRGRPVAALYLYGPSYRFPPDPAATGDLEGLLIDHADTLSATVGSPS